jgi:hypothetical protein
MIVDKINAYLSANHITLNDYIINEVKELAGYAFRRQFMGDNERKAGVLTLSSSGKCPRQLSYKYHGYETKGKEIDSRSKIVFFTGDMSELMIMQLAKLAGVQIMGYGLNQITVKVVLDNESIVEGHPDGYVLDNNIVLAECKSMTTYALKELEHGEVDSIYLAQINMYLEASKLDYCCLVGHCKESGVLAELIIKKDSNIVQRSKDGLKEVLSSTKDNLPNPPATLDKNEDGFYPWNCLYCAYWGHCRTNAEKVLVGSKYKLKEKK